MGVEVYTWAHYGFGGKLEGDSLPQPLRELVDSVEEGHDVEEPVDAWLREQGLSQLLFAVGGNSITGVEDWSLYARGTSTSVDETETYAEMTEPTMAERLQLEDARALLGLERRACWRMQLDLG